MAKMKKVVATITITEHDVPEELLTEEAIAEHKETVRKFIESETVEGNEVTVDIKVV
jgi:hypothetical protein